MPQGACSDGEVRRETVKATMLPLRWLSITWKTLKVKVDTVKKLMATIASRWFARFDFFVIVRSPGGSR